MLILNLKFRLISYSLENLNSNNLIIQMETNKYQ